LPLVRLSLPAHRTASTTNVQPQSNSSEQWQRIAVSYYMGARLVHCHNKMSLETEYILLKLNDFSGHVQVDFGHLFLPGKSF
jgi:hypothetical protein